MVEPSGTFNISGGQQNFGGANPSFTQSNNYYGTGYADEFQKLISLLQRNLEAFSDPESARQQIVLVEQGFLRRGAEDEPVVRNALETLAGQVVAGTTLADAIERAVSLLAAHWPF